MTLVNPEKSRAELKESPERVSIIIPVKRNWFTFLFLSFWLCGWAFGESSVLGSLFGKGPFPHMTPHAGGPAEGFGSAFMLVWLCGWTAGGAFAILTWLYQLRGREIIVRDGRFLSHRRDFVLFKRSKEYLNEHVVNLRMAPPLGFDRMTPQRSLEYWGIGGGTIAFDYGAKTIRMGSGLDEAEAQPLIDALGRMGNG